jgi:hypothetical protein
MMCFLNLQWLKFTSGLQLLYLVINSRATLKYRSPESHWSELFMGSPLLKIKPDSLLVFQSWNEPCWMMMCFLVMASSCSRKIFGQLLWPLTTICDNNKYQNWPGPTCQNQNWELGKEYFTWKFIPGRVTRSARIFLPTYMHSTHCACNKFLYIVHFAHCVTTARLSEL